MCTSHRFANICIFVFSGCVVYVGGDSHCKYFSQCGSECVSFMNVHRFADLFLFFDLFCVLKGMAVVNPFSYCVFVLCLNVWMLFVCSGLALCVCVEIVMLNYFLAAVLNLCRLYVYIGV